MSAIKIIIFTWIIFVFGAISVFAALALTHHVQFFKVSFGNPVVKIGSRLNRFSFHSEDSERSFYWLICSRFDKFFSRAQNVPQKSVVVIQLFRSEKNQKFSDTVGIRKGFVQYLNAPRYSGVLNNKQRDNGNI